MSTLAATMQAFFTDRLIRERNASPNTIAAYRDTMRLLLAFASDQLKIEPSNSRSAISTHCSSARSLNISNKLAAAAREPATAV